MKPKEYATAFAESLALMSNSLEKFKALWAEDKTKLRVEFDSLMSKVVELKLKFRSEVQAQKTSDKEIRRLMAEIRNRIDTDRGVQDDGEC